ncbi:MAG: hypothetical protein EAX87_09375 [Candidatus Thorarchaeota archaeon]|nr:hypothetical protein [Candidatus Thorarchaeota archaeon]
MVLSMVRESYGFFLFIPHHLVDFSIIRSEPKTGFGFSFLDPAMLFIIRMIAHGRHGFKDAFEHPSNLTH